MTEQNIPPAETTATPDPWEDAATSLSSLMEYEEPPLQEDYVALAEAARRISAAQRKDSVQRVFQAFSPMSVTNPESEDSHDLFFIVRRPGRREYSMADMASIIAGGARSNALFNETLVRSCVEYPAEGVLQQRLDRYPILVDRLAAAALRLAGEAQQIVGGPLGKLHPLLTKLVEKQKSAETKTSGA